MEDWDKTILKTVRSLQRSKNRSLRMAQTLQYAWMNFVRSHRIIGSKKGGSKLADEALYTEEVAEPCLGKLSLLGDASDLLL